MIAIDRRRAATGRNAAGLLDTGQPGIYGSDAGSHRRLIYVGVYDRRATEIDRPPVASCKLKLVHGARLFVSNYAVVSGVITATTAIVRMSAPASTNNIRRIVPQAGAQPVAERQQRPQHGFNSYHHVRQTTTVPVHPLSARRSQNVREREFICHKITKKHTKSY